MSRFEEAEAQIKFQNGLVKLSQSKDGISLDLPIKYITLDQNIREKIDFDSTEFKQLVESIKEVGLLQPPVVTADLNDGKILCLGGHRRIEALKFLGHETVKVIYRNLEEKSVQKLAQLIENVARQNLSPLELACTLAQVKSSERYSASRLAELVGKERKYVERMLKIDKWTTNAKELVRSNPDKLNLKVLFSIAGRSLNDDQILKELKTRLGIIERKGATAASKKRLQLTKSVISKYFLQHKIGKTEQEVILAFLGEFKMLTDLKT